MSHQRSHLDFSRVPPRSPARHDVATHAGLTGDSCFPWSDQATGHASCFLRRSVSSWSDGLEMTHAASKRGAADDGELSAAASARANHLLQVPVDIKAPGRLSL